MNINKKEQHLQKLYYNIDQKNALTTSNNLFRAAKKKYRSITKRFVDDWLAKQDTYTLHKRRRKRFLRRKVISRGIDDLHQMDIADFSSLARFNAGYRYLLMIIDCFSRFVWVIPLKRKTGQQVATALKNLYHPGKRIPKRCQFDQGTEFWNFNVKSVFEKYNIKWYFIASRLKAMICERFIRTFRSILAKALYGKPKPRYLEILPDLVNLYNSRVHRSIKMAPKDVNKKNENELWWYQYGDQFPSKTKHISFDIGDEVKIAVEKKLFEKEWTPAWSSKNFIVKHRRSSYPPTYKISDKEGKILPGSYYKSELQLIQKHRV